MDLCEHAFYKPEEKYTPSLYCKVDEKRCIYSKRCLKVDRFIPLEGEIIVYNDYKTIQKEIDGEVTTVQVPGVKIGDGRAFVQDLPFIDEELRDRLMAHINNPNMHVTLQEKLFWNNKLNVDDASEVVDTALVFNRN